MPLYEFECSDCHTIFERIVRSADAAAQVTCRTCHSSRVKKLISSGSHRLGAAAPGTSTGPAQGCRAGSPFR